MATPRSALRYRPTGAGEQQAPISTRRASRERDQSPLSRPPRPIRADVQTDEEKYQGGDDLTMFHPVPSRRKNSGRSAQVSGPSLRSGRWGRTTREDQLKQSISSRHQIRPMFAIGLGLAVAVLCYTLFWGAWLGLSHWENHIRFEGHAPTDTVTASIDGKTTRVVAINSGQQIAVYVFVLGMDKVQIFTEQLQTSTWGSATDQVVPALSMDHGRFQLKLTGDPQYGNLVDPVKTETFAIWPTTAGGYQIERTA